MKQKLLILAFLLLSLSVKSQKKEFQNRFGKINTENLDLLISDFEANILKKKYPKLNMQNAYKSFLKELIKNKMELNDSLIVRGERILQKGNLKFHIYNILDSVWVGKSLLSKNNNKEHLICKYKHIDVNGDFQYSISETSNTNIALKKKAVHKKININGLYMKTLKRASTKSSLIKNYYEQLYLTGSFVSPGILAHNILNNNIDLNNYFVKTIILTNIVYR